MSPHPAHGGAGTADKLGFHIPVELFEALLTGQLRAGRAEQLRQQPGGVVRVAGAHV
ncbi:MAG TPA: hypothetical protein VGH45_05460 [Solirubrobacteraceae bacterium]